MVQISFAIKKSLIFLKNMGQDKSPWPGLENNSALILAILTLGVFKQ